MGTWQAMELKTFISQCVERDIPIIPVLLPEVTEIPESLLFLQQFNAVTFQKEIGDANALYRLEWGITGQKSVKGTLLTPVVPPLDNVRKEIFISYAWGAESEQIVDQLGHVFQSKKNSDYSR